MEELNNLLWPLLKKEDCASCKFCCSFRRKSLWETPVFGKGVMEELSKLYPRAKFRRAGKSGSSYSFDISGEYKSADPNEEAVCPFLNRQNGCSLPSDLKPFDCKIWPLRVVRLPKASRLAIALTPTCPAINRHPLQKVKDLLADGLGQKIISYARQNPDIIKDYNDFLSRLVYE